MKRLFLFLLLAGIAHAQTISPSPGNYTGQVQVTITAPAGATVYYTTDGSTPTANSIKYVSPFTLSSSQTVKAIAISTSAVTSAAYVIVPAPTTYPYTIGSAVSKMSFAWKMGTATPPLQSAQIWDSSPCPPPAGVPTCHWPVTVSSDVPWLTVNSGSTSFTLAASINTAVLKTVGTFTGNITLTQSQFKAPTIKISVTIVVTGAAPPPPPTHSVKMTWSTMPNVTGYKAYHGSNVIFTGDANTFTETNVSSGNACYSVTALYPAESVKSNSICVTIP